MSLCLSFWFCGIQLKRCRLGKLPNTTHHETGSAGEVKNLNAAPKPSSFYFLSWNFIPLGHNFIILKYAYMVKFTEIVSHSHTPGITKGNSHDDANAIRYNQACLWCNRGRPIVLLSVPFVFFVVLEAEFQSIQQVLLQLDIVV